MSHLSLVLCLILSSAFTTHSYAHCDLSDWEALQALYISADGANWTNKTGWDQVDPAINPSGPPVDCHIEEMYGVVLNAAGSVVGIELSANNLTGDIPTELGNLVNLSSLVLDNNNLTGNIPASFGNLVNLTELDISDNTLDGCYDVSLAASGSAGDALLPGGTTYVRPTSTTLVVTDFDPARDMIDVGSESVHTQIAIDGPEGLTFQNMFNQNAALILQGIFLKDLKWFNFAPILDAHLQQDLSATLAYENCTGLSRPNTVYIRSHQPNLVEEVDFNPATDKISFFYLCVRGDEGVNFTVEQTAAGARFYSPYTNQSMTLTGIDFSELNSSHFEWRVNQLEDNVPGRIDLDNVIANFQVDNDNVFNGKSVPMAGGVDQAPYHIYTHPEYTGTAICELNNSVLCNFSNASISEGNNFDEAWEDFCTMSTGACVPNQAPSISINSPANNENFILGDDVVVTATAYDTDGSIANIVMTIDGTSLSSTNTSGNIYEGTWTSTANGTFTINVTVTDNEGLTSTTNTTITVSEEDVPPPPVIDGDYNYGEVLQKSLFFYEAQQSGPLSEDNRVHWRADSALEDGTDSLDLTGGWFDAGDHVKFGFPMAYSATMLAWSGVEDKVAYDSIQQWDTLLNSLRFVNDYLLKCHVRNADGSTDKFYGQVGNGSADHAWWGPAEVMQMERPAYFVDANNPGSDLTGETAAAMAAASMIFAEEDSTYSATLLENAIALYNFADTYRGKYSDAITDATTYYNSWSGYQDELVWGAIWLYRATGDAAWLTKAQTEYAFLSTEQGTNIPSYHWTIAWDDKSYGCYALMAQLTGQQNYKDDTERWLDYWSTGYNGEQITYSSGGQAHLSTWGSLRYAANTSFVALIYSDVIASSNPTKSQAYLDFATTQINYALGSNPNNRSYVCGFGVNPPINPHHRTAHGSWANSIGNPVDSRHILYGALVGGPGSPNDEYIDDRGDYIANEVATDYNAGFTGAIANLVKRFGGYSLPNFPEQEEYDVCEEYFNEAKINASGSTFTEVAVLSTNHSAWPATETDQVSYRYFIDISEGFDAGYTVEDYTMTVNAAPSGTQVSELTQWEETVYYVEVSFPNINIYPGGQSESRKEAQLRIALPNNAPASAWDATNDWSYYYEEGMSLDNTFRTNTRIPFYNDGELLCGTLPGGGNQNSNPVADIVANPISGNAPLSVIFDASGSTDVDGDTLSFFWDFGNDHTHYGEMTGETFNTPGVYTVTLTVDDGNGGTATETVNITVIDPTPLPPTAVIIANPTSGGVPLTVAFDGTNSTDPNADELTYFWGFGDGNSSTMPVFSHTYTAIGTYTATLMVDDGNGGTDTESVIISVTNTAPNASFTASPVFGQPPLDVSFDASASNDANGDNLTYSWNFGDGNTATGVTTNHIYPNEGVYTATLTVDDGNGGTDIFTQTITVSLTTCNLVLKYQTPDNTAGSATDNQIRPQFIVENMGDASIPLQEITIRYWYTKEGNSAQSAWIDYAQVGNENIITNFVELETPVVGADHYFEVGFTSGAGSIAASGNSGLVKTRFAKLNWSNYDETDDYSYNMDYNTFQTWENATVYCNGNLAWGIEPTDTNTPTNTAPVAALTATPTSGTAPLIVAFDASASTDADGDALTYTWNFGDGNTAYGISPNHTYNGQGTYTASVTVSDGTDSDTETIIITVTAEPQPPVAVIMTTTTSGNAPLSVVFSASNSSDPNEDALTYSWNFGDGNTATGEMVNHVFTNVGTYTTSLIVNDGTFTDTATVTIIVTDNPIPPIADIIATPTTGNAPLNVNFDGSNSYDANDDVLTYVWNFGEGNTATGAIVSHVYTNVGTYIATLTVSDGTFTATETVTITVDEAPEIPEAPVADIIATPTTGNAPLNVNFDGSNSYDANGDALTYSWNFGDGNTATGAIVNHVYTNVGTYTATLTVSDGTFDATDTVTIIVGESPEPPVADIIANPTTGTAPLNVNFDGSNSYDANGDVLTYAWNFGDGNEAIGAIVSHVYTNVGTYTATLTVNDGTFDATETVIIVVGESPEPPVADIIANPTTGTAPLNVNFDGSNSYDPNGDALTYDWNFGDGNTATGAIVSHIYTNVGTYTATLTANDGTFNATENVIITVTNGGGNTGACPLSLQYRTFDDSEQSAIDNQIRPHYIIENNGTTSINLSDITVRYWYTKEGDANQEAWIDYAQVGSSNVTTNFVELTSPVAGADHYFEVGFTNSAGTIAPGDDSGEVQARFAKIGWSNYDENDDYSYNMNHSTFLPWDKVTVYCNGELAWGTELDGADDGGGTGDTNNAPIASVTANPTTGTAPLLVQFDASASMDADGDVLTYSWNFDDGNTATGSNPTHTYTAVGNYTATVTVNDGNGGTDTANVNITVESTDGGGSDNGDIEVVFTVDNVWNTGYCTTVEMFNNGSTDINGWTLDFSINASIDNLWNADWANTSGDNHTASNLSWNAVIEAGDSRTFGYCATHNGSVDAPTNGVFNDIPVEITFVNENSFMPSIPESLSSSFIQTSLLIEPNIANGQTSLKYELPAASPVQLLLFDQTGRLVRTIVDERQLRGVHALKMQTNDLVEGLYFVRLLAQDVSLIERLIVIK